MNWIQLKADCETAELETVCAVMSMLDNGLMIEDVSDIDTIYGELVDESILNADKTHASVSIFVPCEKPINDYTAFLRERFSALGIKVGLSLIGVDEEEWATSWKQYYKPVKIGEKIVVVPVWETYKSKPGEIIILMDPGMAFGTGTHETTRLCVSLVEKYVGAGDSVLDVGTGSGILSVEASKLGAGSVCACDIDPVAVRVAKENAEMNGCPNITCFVSDLLAQVDGEFDTVCANIVADIIIRMAPDLSSHVKEGGHVVLSGIIDASLGAVMEKMEECGFTFIEKTAENGWNGIVYTKLSKNYKKSLTN